MAAMRRRLRLAAALAGALSLIALAGGIASGEVVQLGKLIITFDGGFRPTTLPKHSYAPITLWGRGDISTVDGTLPTAVSRVVIDWDRNGLLTTKGLPRCNPNKLENTTTPAAMSACRHALVGEGFASGEVQFPDDPPFPASSKVLIFNGTPRGGHPVILLHAYAYVPAPTTFVVPVIITKVHKGRYKYESTLDAPVIAGGYGVVTHFDFKIHRLWSFHGQRLSYLAARCADGRLQATGVVTFVDGSSATGSAFRPCHTRK
jgi:hypothetical protein